MTNYTYVKLSDLCTDRRGHYGLGTPAEDSGTYRFLRITDIREDGTLDYKSPKYTSRQDADKYILHPNDIVIARTGANAGKSYLYDEDDGALVHANFLVRFSIDRKKADPLYLKYYFMSDRYKDWLHTVSGDGIRPNINAKKLGDMRIPLPSLEKQHEIAGQLSVFDEAVKTNRKIIRNAERQTQCMYEKLFVSGANSEWPEKTLGDMITIRSGKKCADTESGEIPVFGSGGVLGYTGKPVSTKEAVLIPRKGSLWNVFYPGGPFWAINTMYYAFPKSPDTGKYIYYFLKNADLAQLDTGTAVPSIKKEDLLSVTVRQPDEAVLVAFEKFSTPFFSLVKEKLEENKKLADLGKEILQVTFSAIE